MSTNGEMGAGGAAQPSPTYYLKIAEIKGDAVHKEHEGEITVRSWGWGEKQSRAAGHNEKGRVSMDNFVVTATYDSAGPLLFQYCASGKPLKSAVLTWVVPDGKEFKTWMTVELTDVAIASCNFEGPRDSLVPTMVFSIVFRKIEFKYAGNRPDGSPGKNVTASWDLSEDK